MKNFGTTFVTPGKVAETQKKRWSYTEEEKHH